MNGYTECQCVLYILSTYTYETFEILLLFTKTTINVICMCVYTWKSLLFFISFLFHIIFMVNSRSLTLSFALFYLCPCVFRFLCWNSNTKFEWHLIWLKNRLMTIIFALSDNYSSFDFITLLQRWCEKRSQRKLVRTEEIAWMLWSVVQPISKRIPWD